MNIEELNFDDSKVWDMIGTGAVKGCFQIEGHLGKTWAQKLKPTNINELAALISLIRPGVLKAKVDGKSMTEKYVDRKNKVEEIEYMHDSIKELLKETYGIIVFQEQSMKISQKMARFDLMKADDLRKAIGKKKADLMNKVRDDFIEGCKNNNIDEETIVEVFDIIEKSNRYSFNKCLDPTTVVETKEGYKLLSEVEIGDYVLGPTEQGDEFIPVLDIIDCGEQELYEITLESGSTITCTMSHKFLCSDGEKHTLSDILDQELEIMEYS